MRRLKAFTIVELVVVMIISIITLATIYTVYLLVKKQYLRQSGKAELLNSYLQFKNTITNDFNNADSVKGKVDDQSFTCYIDSAVILYKFSERSVTRTNNNFVDSFVVFPQGLDITVHENTELINTVSVKIIPAADTVLLQLTKQYDASCLLKIKPD